MKQRYKLFPTVLSLLFCCCFILVGCTGRVESEPEPTEKPKLSSMTEEACREFLADAGVIIPAHLEGASVIGIVKDLENDPYMANPFDYTVAFDLVEDIRSVVMDYYGVAPEPTEG